MDKSFLLNARGYFWWSEESVPEGRFAPSNFVSGSINIDAAGLVRLQFDGILPRESRSNLAAIFDDKLQHRSIIGILAGESSKVLLTDLYRDGANAASQGPSTEGMIAQRCMVSASTFPPGCEPLFDALELDLSGYEEWLGLRSIEIDMQETSFDLKHERPADIIWDTDIGILTLVYDFSRPISGKANKVSLREFARLRLELRNRVGMPRIQELAGRIEELFILLTDSEKGFAFPKATSIDSKNKISLFWRRQKQEVEEILSQKCWIRFFQIKEEFGKILSSWINQHAVYGPGFHLYVGNRRQTQMYPEHKFVSLVWGIESLHRKMRPAKTVSSRLASKILRILYAVKEKKDIEWLARQLGGSFEPSLATRIFESLDPLPLNLAKQPLTKFCERCANRRNDVSHFGGMRNATSYEEFLEDIIELTTPLDLLYHARLLQIIGVPNDCIRFWFVEGFEEYRIREYLKRVGLELPERAKRHAASSADKPPAL